MFLFKTLEIWVCVGLRAIRFFFDSRDYNYKSEINFEVVEFYFSVFAKGSLQFSWTSLLMTSVFYQFVSPLTGKIWQHYTMTECCSDRVKHEQSDDQTIKRNKKRQEKKKKDKAWKWMPKLPIHHSSLTHFRFDPLFVLKLCAYCNINFTG